MASINTSIIFVAIQKKVCYTLYLAVKIYLKRGFVLADTSSIKQLLEAGAHFGHQASGWHPRMKKYIFTKRNGIHIIDLEQTVKFLAKMQDFVKEIVADGGTVLFVGTKKQAQESVESEAKRCGMYYVNQRWLGGTLTNFATIQSRIDYLVRLEDQKAKGEFNRRPKKEASKLEEEIIRLNRQLGGIKEMTKLPNVLFIIDPTKDRIALMEAKRMNIPVAAICDTNCNPDELDVIVPANDDAIRAVKLICVKIADAVIEGKGIQVVVPKEEVTEEEAAKVAQPAPVSTVMEEALIVTEEENNPDE
jgi:small subunit ribosomal protein S2